MVACGWAANAMDQDDVSRFDRSRVSRGMGHGFSVHLMSKRCMQVICDAGGSGVRRCEIVLILSSENK